jgi:predicted HTH transcriptional regulator
MQSFIEIMKLQNLSGLLAQSEGQGIPTIIRTMKEEGCPAPIFEMGTDSVTYILPAHPRHRIIREIQKLAEELSIALEGKIGQL